MKTKPYFTLLESIHIDARQRKYFDEGKLIDLAEDIKTNGLIHAPAISDEGQLIAGERRLRAIVMLHRKGELFTYMGETCPPDHIPVSVIPVQGKEEEVFLRLKEMELSENLIRENLSWQERAQAERELHQLRLDQTQGKQTPTATAEEIKGAPPSPQETVRLKENLFLAQHLEDPAIARVKNRKDALRLAKEKVMRERRAALAEEYKVTDPKKESPHKLIHGSALEEFPALPLFDLLLTDPPYGMDANEFGSQFLREHNYEDSETDWPALMRGLAYQSFQRSKDQAHAFVFCHINKWGELASYFSDEGWAVWPRPLIWDKGSLGSLPKPQHGPRFCYEAILFASKGNKPVLKTGRDVLAIPTPAKSFHAAEKPVDLYSELIARTVEPGGLILDPFCGSGTIFPAATRQAVKAIGIEKEKEHYNTALTRLNEEA